MSFAQRSKCFSTTRELLVDTHEQTFGALGRPINKVNPIKAIRKYVRDTVRRVTREHEKLTKELGEDAALAALPPPLEQEENIFEADDPIEDDSSAVPVQALLPRHLSAFRRCMLAFTGSLGLEEELGPGAGGGGGGPTSKLPTSVRASFAVPSETSGTMRDMLLSMMPASTALLKPPSGIVVVPPLDPLIVSPGSGELSPRTPRSEEKVSPTEEADELIISTAVQVRYEWCCALLVCMVLFL